MSLTNVRDQMEKYSLETAGEYLTRACAEEAPMRNLLARDRTLQEVRHHPSSQSMAVLMLACKGQALVAELPASQRSKQGPTRNLLARDCTMQEVSQRACAAGFCFNPAEEEALHITMRLLGRHIPRQRASWLATG